jgi:hypothetical protein
MFMRVNSKCAHQVRPPLGSGWEPVGRRYTLADSPVPTKACAAGVAAGNVVLCRSAQSSEGCVLTAGTNRAFSTLRAFNAESMRYAASLAVTADLNWSAYY